MSEAQTGICNLKKRRLVYYAGAKYGSEIADSLKAVLFAIYF